MRRASRFLCVAVWFLSCRGSHPATGQPANSESFITSAYLAASGDADVCALATRQARLPETRELGAALQRTLTGVRDDLAAAAQWRGLALPKGAEEKKLALRDNLAMLPGRIFDQGYALAMFQDTRAMLQMEKASDADLRNIITKYDAQLRSGQNDASRVLDQAGGIPWPVFEP
jgi:uncharacterized protein DUF4142